MKLGEKIKKLRLEHNMTQEDLANKCYVTRNAVSKWENDNGMPNIESILLICNCFNITVDNFLKGNINKEEENNDITNTIIKESQKKIKLLQYIFMFSIVLLYPIFQIMLRELVFNSDPTAGLAWGFVFAPVLSMILAIISCIIIRNYKLGILSGIIGYVLTIFIDCLLKGFNNFFEDQILINGSYFVFFVVLAIIAYSIKYQRLIIIPSKLKKYLSQIIEIKINIKSKTKLIIVSCILITTITIFIFLLTKSIYNDIYSISQSEILFLNGTPLAYILVFIIPIALEILWFISTLNKYKSEKKEKSEENKESNKKNKWLPILGIILPIIYIIISILPLFQHYNNLCSSVLWVEPYKSIFQIYGYFSIILILIYAYTIISSILYLIKKYKTLILVINILLSTTIFIISIILIFILFNKEGMYFILEYI